MSAVFKVMFRGLWVKFMDSTDARQSYELVGDSDSASVFTSESEAWQTVWKHRMDQNFCDVVPGS